MLMSGTYSGLVIASHSVNMSTIHIQTEAHLYLKPLAHIPTTLLQVVSQSLLSLRVLYLTILLTLLC